MQLLSVVFTCLLCPFTFVLLPLLWCKNVRKSETWLDRLKNKPTQVQTQDCCNFLDMIRGLVIWMRQMTWGGGIIFTLMISFVYAHNAILLILISKWSYTWRFLHYSIIHYEPKTIKHSIDIIFATLFFIEPCSADWEWCTMKASTENAGKLRGPGETLIQ